jgi:hypothetical protein
MTHTNGFNPIIWALHLEPCGLSALDRLVLLMLAKYADRDGNCFPTLAMLQRDVGVCRRQVQRTVAALERAGVISIEKGVGRGHASNYRLLMDLSQPARSGVRSGGEGGEKVSPETPFNGEKVSHGHLLPGEKVTFGTLKGDSGVTPTTHRLPNRDSSLRSAERKPSIRSELMKEGVPIVVALIGKSEQSARGFIAVLLKGTHDDCPRVLNLLREAAELRPIDPAAWLMARTKPRKLNAMEDAQERWGLISFAHPAALEAAKKGTPFQ